MERRREVPRPLVLQTLTLGLAAAAALLLLPAVHRILMVIGWALGMLVGDAVAAAVRGFITLIGALLRRHASVGSPPPLPAALVFGALDRRLAVRMPAKRRPATSAPRGGGR